MRILSSSEYYDQLAADYREISDSRTAYLAGVERLITQNLRPGLSLLDVGGADGVRAQRLAHQAGITRVTLLDSSPAMLARVDPSRFERVIEGDITSEATCAQLGEARFDVALIRGTSSGTSPRLKPGCVPWVTSIARCVRKEFSFSIATTARTLAPMVGGSREKTGCSAC